MNEHSHTFEIGDDSTETIIADGPKGHVSPDESDVAKYHLPGVDADDVTWVLTEEREPTGVMTRSGALPCVSCRDPVWGSADRAREQYESDSGYWKCGSCVEDEREDDTQ